MAIKDARKAATKKPTYANTAGSGSSVAMAEMPPHGANHVQPPPPRQLPPGVYFSPSREECLGFLNRRIAGDTELRDVREHIRSANVYGESPDALRQRHPPASIRDREPTWWFLSQTRFQSKTAGGGTSKRAARHVETGGYWRLEQSKEKLDDDGFKNCFGYYVDGHSKSKRKDKTPWLMQEFTSTNDDGAGKGGVPALYRVYVTPRATNDQLSELFGEEGVKNWPDGTKKPAHAMVPVEYFDGVTALLPEGSVRGVVAQEHAQAQAPPPPPPAAPEGLLEYYSQQEHYLGQYQQPPPLPPVAPEGLDDLYSEQGQYLGPYQQYQQDQYLPQYEQQQSMVAPPLPPPASPGLLAELGAEAPSDNLSMPMAYFMRMMDEEPAAMVSDEQPAVTIKGEEPNWESFDNIVDVDELAKFNEG